jgi:hypothetical protein
MTTRAARLARCAPGGCDDGQGTTAILALARAIGSDKSRFHYNVEHVLFHRKKQGLLGSSKARARTQGADRECGTSGPGGHARPLRCVRSAFV